MLSQSVRTFNSVVCFCLKESQHLAILLPTLKAWSLFETDVNRVETFGKDQSLVLISLHFAFLLKENVKNDCFLTF